MTQLPLHYLIEKSLQFRCVKNAFYYLNSLLYSRCFLTGVISLLVFIFCYLAPLKTGNYSISFEIFQFHHENLADALTDSTYSRLLIVTLFLAIPAAVQLLLDSWKLFSKDPLHQVEFWGFVVLVAGFTLPNAMLYFTFNDLTPSQVKPDMLYTWVALSRIQTVTITFGLFTQLFCHREKYANSDNLSFLRFSIERRTVNVMLLMMISSIFTLLNGSNKQVTLFNLLSTVFWSLGELLQFLSSLRVMFSLTIQAIYHRQFQTHHHVSDFMFCFGLVTYFAIQFTVNQIGVSQHFTTHNLFVFLVSSLSTQIFLSVIVIVIPGVKNQRLAEIKHEQLETRLNLIRYVSHEMRTPLNTVSMGMNILKEEIVEISGLSSFGLNSQSCSPTSQREQQEVKGGIFDEATLTTSSKVFFLQKFKDILDTVNQVTDSCCVAVSTLDDLLTFDKIDEKKLVIEVEDLNPWKLLQETARPFSVNALLKNINFRVILSEKPDFLKNECIQGDAFKLAQVIRNLLSNALKFTPESGTVDVSLSLWESVERGRNVRFSVKDTGAGISKQNMKKLFGQYVQFNAAQLQGGKGSGLGLWITKSIVEMHGGVIGALSDGEGLGTEFYFDIPLRPLSRTSRSAKKRNSTIFRIKTSQVQQPPAEGKNPSNSGRVDDLTLLEEGLAAIRNLSPITEAAVHEDEVLAHTSLTTPRLPPPQSKSPISGFPELLLRIFGFRRGGKIHMESGCLDEATSTIRGQRESAVGGTVQNFLNYPVSLLNRNKIESYELSSDKSSEQNDKNRSTETMVTPMYPLPDLEIGGQQHSDEIIVYPQTNGRRAILTESKSSEKLFSTNLRLERLSLSDEEAEVLPNKKEIQEIPLTKDLPSMGLISELVTTPKLAYTPRSELDQTGRLSDSLKSSGTEPLLGPEIRSRDDSKARAWTTGLHILLVDDADSNRKMCRRILTSHGHQTIEAKDGLDCLRVYDEQSALHKQFDLILMDDNMPNLLGFEAAKCLRDRGYKGVLLGVTGDVYPDNIQRFIRNGANDVLSKPLNLPKLKEKYNLHSEISDF